MQYVPKGANRAYHNGKTARHAQRTPLPPRPGQVDDAKEAIGMAKDKKDKTKKDKGRKEEKASAKALRKAEQASAQPATMARTASEASQATGDTHPKAQAFYADAAAAGWDVSVESRGADVRSDTVTAIRGTESIVIEWQNGVFIPPCLHTRADGSEGKPRNAMDARRVLSAPAPSAEALAARSAVRARISGTTPRARARDFSFDPGLLTDAELTERLQGCKVVWVNRISGMEEEEHVRGRVSVHDGTSGRQVTFLGSAYRTVLVSSITSVTGGRKLAKA